MLVAAYDRRFFLDMKLDDIFLWALQHKSLTIVSEAGNKSV